MLLGVMNIVDVVYEPLHGCVQVVTLVLDGAHRVHRPVSLHTAEFQLGRNQLQVHGCNVALVGQHQQHCLLHVRVLHDALQLAGGQLDPLLVGAVDDVDKPSAFVEVVGPQTAQFLLSAHVPHHKVYGFVSQLLHIEPDGRDGVYGLAELESVERGGLAGSVQAQHQDFALPLGHLLVEQVSYQVSHLKKFTIIGSCWQSQFNNFINAYQLYILSHISDKASQASRNEIGTSAHILNLIVSRTFQRRAARMQEGENNHIGNRPISPALPLFPCANGQNAPTPLKPARSKIIQKFQTFSPNYQL